MQILRETRIPFELVNRAFRQAMLAIGLRITINLGQARISFDQEFKALTGLSDVTIDVTDRLRDINLQQYSIYIGTDVAGVPTIYAGLDLEERGSELDLPGPDGDIENMAIALRVLLLYSYPGWDFFSTAMRRENGDIYSAAMSLIAFLDAHPHLDGLWADFVDGLLAVGGAVGISKSSIDEYIQEAVHQAEGQLNGVFLGLGTYFYDTVMHLADRGDIMHSLSADDEAVIVRHHAKPGLRDFLDEFPPDLPESTGLAREAVRLGISLGAESIPGTVPTPAATRRASRRPSAGPAANINHIVVLMLENRSFDHMLGYRGLGNSQVNGLSGSESNDLAEGGPPYPVFHLVETAGLISPEHGFQATLDQIDGGNMSGFVESYAHRPGVADPSRVMGYYTGNELPMYDFLASNYGICDNWHSSHPGETQCNRFCALTGRTPELDNLDLADPRVAYYDAVTVFDALTAMNVDWVYAEGNIGFLRMFDRYRLDVRNVIPFDDHLALGVGDTFVTRVRDGHLPRVAFVDPRYIDVPPQSDANDDLPPADVCGGQDLVRTLFRILTEAPTWPQTLLIVTYDEHGGFYDHSAPIGTPLSRDRRPVPRVHPDGADHLGVRVPALVVSPWIDAGTVVHTVFDHTSIMKTILDRFAPAGFPIADVFGKRAAAATGLLGSLRKTARVDMPIPPAFVCPELIETQATGSGERGDFHTTMRLLGVPWMYRDRLGT